MFNLRRILLNDGIYRRRAPYERVYPGIATLPISAAKQ